MRKIMSVLDVGSDTIKLIVGEMIKSRLNVLDISSVITEGMQKNNIIDANKLSECIKKLFQTTSEKLGMDVSKTIVIIPSKNAEFTIGEGIIKINNENNLIAGSDISKVLMESTSGVIQDNMELVSVTPTIFRLDNNQYSKDPKGSISTKLGVRSVIISSPKSVVYPILEILEKLNIDVVDISFDAVGDYYANKNANTDNKVGAVVNIGNTKTTISIFNKGILTNISTIELGGENIDNDISYIYKVPRTVSRKLKEEFALASIRLASQNDTLEVVNKNGEKIRVNQYEVSNIITSRLKEILSMIKKEINHLTKKELSYIIFSGGTTELQDFNLVLEEMFGKIAKIGCISELGARNNKYSSALGLIRWYNELEKLKDKDYSIFTIDDQEDLSGIQKQGTISDNSIIGKVFGYFFDN